MPGHIYPSVSIRIGLKPATHTRISLSFSFSLPPILHNSLSINSSIYTPTNVHPQRICHKREQLDRAASVQGPDHRQCQGMCSRHPSFQLGRLAITSWLNQNRESGKQFAPSHFHTAPATNLGSRLSFPLNPLNPLVFGSVCFP